MWCWVSVRGSDLGNESRVEAWSDARMAQRRRANDQLAGRARGGETAAAGEYFAQNLSFIRTMANKIAHAGIDPDDLAAEAISRLLAQWARGEGPATDVNGYLIRSMRNRMIDEWRSPRSRTAELNEDQLELPPFYDSTLSTDLAKEFQYVTDALKSLPRDQQFVLVETLVQGRKPAELAAELGRPANAIYSLNRRAKLGLRRATLRAVLQDAAPSECQEAAESLPERVADDIGSTTNTTGMSHIRECDRCRRAWATFASLSTALGVPALMVVSNTVNAPGAQAVVVSSDPETESEHVENLPGARRRSFGATFAAIAAILVGVLTVVAAVAGWSFDGIRSPGERPRDAADTSQLAVTSEVESPGHARLDVNFSTRAQSTQLELTLPAGMRITQLPATWNCGRPGATVTCEASGSVTGVIELQDDRDEELGEYRLAVRADYGGYTVTGSAHERITATPRRVSATSESPEYQWLTPPALTG